MRTTFCSIKSAAVSVIDFDRGRLRAPGAWTAGNLARLQRSLTKIAACVAAGSIHAGSLEAFDGRIPGSLTLRFVYSWLIRCAVPFAYAMMLWRGTERSQLLAGIGGASRVRRSLTDAEHLAACGFPGRDDGRGTAAARVASALSAAAAGGDHRDAGGQGAAAGAVCRKMPTFDFCPTTRPDRSGAFSRARSPRVAIIMETELWPNLLRECERRGVPVLLASARLSEVGVALSALRQLFSAVCLPQNLVVAAQTDGDAERFRAIGAACRTDPCGRQCEIRFGVGLPAVVQAGQNLRDAFGAHRPVWIAGSTHAGEEEQVLDAHALLQAAVPDALLLLVPRHKDRFAAVADLLSRRGVEFARRSQMAGAGRVRCAATAPVLLADTVGELTTLYACGGCCVRRRQPGADRRAQFARAGGPGTAGADRTFLPQRQGDCAIAVGARRRAAGEQRATNSRRRCSGCWRTPSSASRIGGIGQEIVAANRGSVERLLVLIEPWLPAAHPSAAAAQACP